MKINKIIFMGTPQFAVPILDHLTNNGYKPLLCVTQPDKPQGRKRKLTAPVVKQKSIELGIPVIQPENINDNETEEQIKELNPDLIITAAYGGYIGRNLRKLPRFGAINIHPSLLPAWRGASPVNASLWAGDQETGVTIFRLVAKMDAGPVLYQSRYTIKEEDNYTKLLDKLAIAGAEDLIEMIHRFENGTAKETIQDETKATHCRKLNKEDFLINWADQAKGIYNQVRALAEKPGASTTFRKRPLKIISTRITDNKSNKAPGSVVEVIKNSGILVATGDKDLLIEYLQPAGKKIMSAFDFNLGARIEMGERFGEPDESE
ncbi:MAG: methionyl-tRNA formyltransferase [Candidatus Stygibacter frigidus]|nr:methionyl-tRNA formyltransferase [Candidatus Stygibacter frigidus]